MSCNSISEEGNPYFQKCFRRKWSYLRVFSSLNDFTLFKGHSLVIVSNQISPERQQLANIIFQSLSILCVGSNWIKFCLEKKIITINKFIVGKLTEKIINRLKFNINLLSDQLHSLLLYISLHFQYLSRKMTRITTWMAVENFCVKRTKIHKPTNGVFGAK